MVSRLARATHHPAFYAVLAGIALQDPASSYTGAVAQDIRLAGVQAVLRIAVGFGSLSLAFLEIQKRNTRQ